MKKCMTSTMLGEIAYTLKDIEFNENIKISKLRNDIKNGQLKPSGRYYGAYYIIQSELDRYLKEHDPIKLERHIAQVKHFRKEKYE